MVVVIALVVVVVVVVAVVAAAAVGDGVRSSESLAPFLPGKRQGAHGTSKKGFSFQGIPKSPEVSP